MENAQIMIANDHGGYELKLCLLDYLRSHDIPFSDLGCQSTMIVRYPNYAAEVAAAVSLGKVQRGILICSTGIGMCITANRFRGVRASLCTSSYMAKMTRAHNDSNILCMGGMITGKLEALDILEVWLKTKYEGGRHDISLGLIRQLDSALSAKELSEAPILREEVGEITL